MTEKTRPPAPPLVSRRNFLLLTACSLLLGACGKDWPGGRPPRIGLALGGGGAKGLAHIPMLEVFDVLGLRPHRIAGTSIGAVIGALYASGLTGAGIRGQLERFLVKDGQFLPLPRSIRWLDFLDPSLGKGGLLSSDDFIAFLGEMITARSFRDLEIPLKVTAAELRSGKPVILESGALLPAVQASMAVPGVFPPVEIDGVKLVDGGVANPLPYDLLMDECDVVVAIDVSGNNDRYEEDELSSLGVLFHSFQIMSRNILAEKLRQQRPDIYLKPDIREVRMLEFYKARQVLIEARPAQQDLIEALQRPVRRRRGRPGCSIAVYNHINIL